MNGPTNKQIGFAKKLEIRDPGKNAKRTDVIGLIQGKSQRRIGKQGPTAGDVSGGSLHEHRATSTTNYPRRTGYKTSFTRSLGGHSGSFGSRRWKKYLLTKT